MSVCTKKKRGRPSLPSGNQRGRVVQVRIREWEHEILCQEAEGRGFRSLSAYIRDLLGLMAGYEEVFGEPPGSFGKPTASRQIRQPETTP